MEKSLLYVKGDMLLHLNEVEVVADSSRFIGPTVYIAKTELGFAVLKSFPTSEVGINSGAPR